MYVVTGGLTLEVPGLTTQMVRSRPSQRPRLGAVQSYGLPRLDWCSQASCAVGLCLWYLLTLSIDDDIAREPLSITFGALKSVSLLKANISLNGEGRINYIIIGYHSNSRKSRSSWSAADRGQSNIRCA